ncbi:hypothetical protein KI427_27370 (plasmid) [Rhodococcus ruber]|nr:MULTISPECIES: hypothetical protein [Rhodococcus]MDV6296753.1 hypothetical protein [Rhodococcus aetherivorans]UQB75953.1 hypothetical protein KI427_27370 [Rhodococcus ruber]
MKPGANDQAAVDRDGREWTLFALDGRMKGRLAREGAAAILCDLDELVEMHGPLVLSPPRLTVTGGFAAIADTVGLVASDPETASIEQIRQVAVFAQSILLPQGRQSA